jgi:hypothetical protein
MIQGIDDILALLLAFAASPEEVEVLLVSLTFGNIEVERYAIYNPANMYIYIYIYIYLHINKLPSQRHVHAAHPRARNAMAQIPRQAGGLRGAARTQADRCGGRAGAAGRPEDARGLLP